MGRALQSLDYSSRGFKKKKIINHCAFTINGSAVGNHRNMDTLLESHLQILSLSFLSFCSSSVNTQAKLMNL